MLTKKKKLLSSALIFIRTKTTRLDPIFSDELRVLITGNQNVLFSAAFALTLRPFFS